MTGDNDEPTDQLSEEEHAPARKRLLPWIGGLVVVAIGVFCKQLIQNYANDVHAEIVSSTPQAPQSSNSGAPAPLDPTVRFCTVSFDYLVTRCDSDENACESYVRLQSNDHCVPKKLDDVLYYIDHKNVAFMTEGRCKQEARRLWTEQKRSAGAQGESECREETVSELDTFTSLHQR